MFRRSRTDEYINHLQLQLQQEDEGSSPDDAAGTTFGPSLATEEDSNLEKDADPTIAPSTDLPNLAELIEGPVDGATLHATTPPIVTNVIEQPLSQSQIYAELEDIENAERASEKTFEEEALARNAAAADAAALTQTHVDQALEDAKLASMIVAKQEAAGREARAALAPAAGPGAGATVIFSSASAAVFSSTPAADEGSFEDEEATSVGASSAAIATSTAVGGGDSILDVDGAIVDPAELVVAESEVRTTVVAISDRIFLCIHVLEMILRVLL